MANSTGVGGRKKTAWLRVLASVWALMMVVVVVVVMVVVVVVAHSQNVHLNLVLWPSLRKELLQRAYHRVADGWSLGKTQRAHRMPDQRIETGLDDDQEASPLFLLIDPI